MSVFSNLFNVLAAGLVIFSLLRLQKIELEFDALSRTMLYWFLSVLTLTATLNLLPRDIELVNNQRALLDLLLSISQILAPIFFLLFITTLGQSRWHSAASRKQRDYQSILAKLPGVSYRSSGNEQALLLEVSDDIESLLGVPAETFRSGQKKSLLDYMHPDDRDTMLPSYLECIADNRPFTLEYRLITPEGDQIWVIDRGHAVPVDNGSGHVVEGILLNATRLVSAEQKLSQQEEDMRKQQKALLELCEFSGSLEHAMQLVTRIMAETLNTSRAGVWLYSQDRTRVQCLDLYARDTSEHVYNIELALTEFPGYFGFMEFGDVIAAEHAQEDERTAELTDNYLKPLDIRSLMDTPFKIDGEVRGIVCAEHQHEVRKWSIDEQNFARSVANVVSLMLEISVNRQIEQDLRTERDRAQSYLDTVNVIIVSLDKDGFVSLVNNRACELLGYTQEEFKGKHWVSSFVPEDEREELLKVVSNAYQDSGNMRSSYENHVLTKDGKKLWVRWSNAYQTDENGKITGLLAAGEDITELTQQRMEKERLQEEMQQIQKMRSIVQLTGGIAHDFNNMLTSIMGYADLAQISMKRNAGIDSERYLGAIRATSKKAGNLVSQLLDYSRENVLVKAPINLNELVRDSQRMLEAMMSTSVQLIDELDEDLPNVTANQAQLQQVLVNLCQNAKEALRNQDATLWIKTSVKQVSQATCSSCFQKTSGRFVSLEITDNGIGIDPAIGNNMFDPFTTTKELGEGTGLGLSAVHGIVHMHGGHILVQSDPGQLTRFSVLLPIAEERQDDQPADEASAQKQVTRPDRAMQAGPTRILLVDDDESVTRLLANFLQRNGMKTEIMNNSENAWDLFSENSAAYDIVITDHTMPNLTGLELTRKIRSVRSDIPVVLCSGYNELVNEDEAAELGVSHFLNKPVRLENLASVISDLTSKQN